jgi:hypothetical protein
LFDINGFEISIHQCPTHYSHAGNGGVLDMEVYQNVHILDHVRVTEFSDPAEKFKV